MASVDDMIIRVILKILYFIGLYFVFFWIYVLIEHRNREDNINSRRVWPEITIVIPVYNEEDCLNRTISKLYEVDYPKDKLKVICVNDGSKDNSLKILKKLNKKYPFKLIDQKNQGKFMAMNNALEIIDTPIFACIDADSFIEKHSLKRIVECFDDSDVAAATPMMKVYNPQNILVRAQWLEYMINMFYVKIFSKINCMHVVPGPLGTYRTSVVKKLGLFREGHKTEDLEMGMRLQSNHYKIKHCHTATIYTKSPETTKGVIDQRIRWYKGTILNLKDYKHMIFNKSYGDFGFFHIPLVAISGLMIILGVFAFVYGQIKALVKTIREWAMQDFDWSVIFGDISFKFDILTFDWKAWFLSIIMLLSTVLIVHYSLKNGREKLKIFTKISDFFTLVFYFFVYNFIMFYIWLKVFYAVIFRKDYKWYKVR